MIDSYNFGSITVNGKTYKKDIIIFPDRVRDNWWREEGHNVSINDIKEIIEYGPEVVIFGQGSPGYMKVPDRIRDHLAKNKIECIVRNTHDSCEEYNRICGVKRTVAALHLTC